MAADERFADNGEMVIFFVFLLGVGNFALNKAVLESRHPVFEPIMWLVDLFGGRGSLAIEFVVLLAAMLLVAGGHPGWAWVYLAYSALNGLAAWLILSGRI